MLNGVNCNELVVLKIVDVLLSFHHWYCKKGKLGSVNDPLFSAQNELGVKTNCVGGYTNQPASLSRL